jgi:cell division protein FtsB
MKRFWFIIRKYLLNKYVFVLVVFGLIIGFVGEQSLRVRWHKGSQIRELKEQSKTYQHAIDQAKHDLQILQSTDSLEKYAREKYLMHADNEDVYLIDE